MQESLASLEFKIEQVLGHCQGLRAENRQLRQRLSELEADKRAMAARIDEAAMRLEALMERLPQE